MGKKKKIKEWTLVNVEAYHYYLPCLNPKVELIGSMIRVQKPINVGDTFNEWGVTVRAIEVPECKKSTVPNYRNVPIIKVEIV